MNKTSCQFHRQLSYFATVGILAATSFFGVETAQAADWRIEPEIRAGYEYDDNASLNAIMAPIEIQGYILEGSATIRSATPRTTFELRPMIRTRNYDEESFDSDDGFLNLNFNYNGLKSNFRLRGNYAQESVRTAEREQADPNVGDPEEIQGDDTGTAFIFGKRDKFWILPQWSYKLSEKSTLAANIKFRNVDYNDQVVGAFNPYSDTRIEAAFFRGFSTRTRGYVKAGARRYEPDVQGAGAVDLDGTAFNIGFERDLTQTMQFRAEAGIEESKPSGGESDSNPVWDINLVNQLETITLLAQVKRSVNASGFGRVSLRDSFNLSVNRQFSDRVDGGLGIRAYSTSRLDSDPGNIEERDYVQFRAQMTYALSRTFSVQAEYRYTHVDRSTITDSAKSNNIFLWFTWQPNAVPASR